VVLSNLSDPVLNYADTLTVTLEVKETGQTFTKTLTSGLLERFAYDTITVATGFDLAKGTYTFKAYFTSVLDVDRNNDTLETSLIINPELNLRLVQLSGNNTCLLGDFSIRQDVILTNTGNMDLYNIDLILQIDTGQTGDPYIIITETCTDMILAGDSITYSFQEAYNVPWNADYYPRISASLTCDSDLIQTTTAIIECTDMKDLSIVKIDNPSTGNDRIGDVIQVSTTLYNRSDHDPFNSGVNITVLVENSQRTETARFTETTGAINISSTVNHTFNQSYTVPNDSVYYLTVYIESNENYPHNDTASITRYTEGVGIASTGVINAFTLAQNIPNPAINSTRIDYSVPEAGEVVFHVHSITGQLLYSQTIDTKRGTHSIELNTSTFAAGVYFYSMEYKGQKQVRQLIINN
jgi:hypothetical protein